MKPNAADGTMGFGVADDSFDEPALVVLRRRVERLEAALKRVGEPVRLACFTNLDKFQRVRWPTTAAYAPQKGEWIEGRSWDGSEIVARLTVIQITHCTNEDGPYLRVELHQ